VIVRHPGRQGPFFLFSFMMHCSASVHVLGFSSSRPRSCAVRAPTGGNHEEYDNGNSSPLPVMQAFAHFGSLFTTETEQLSEMGRKGHGHMAGESSGNKASEAMAPNGLSLNP